MSNKSARALVEPQANFAVSRNLRFVFVISTLLKLDTADGRLVVNKSVQSDDGTEEAAKIYEPTAGRLYLS
ncbi:hypothetical protein FISHEDRAFT_78766 [Fistulina hepatica ATCC 64428]|uniref:Uncharacterized protein n=1 Tax=Fistulina hepatica ATCC 64428 TaxID=1128425 RepID=A0A0D7A066_9AGAR|nr:hypothetical protein FISHEDRAFT_78766 [Fistulina hepatica ATCC 64428]